MQHEALKKEFVEAVRQQEMLLKKVCSLYAIERADQKDLFQEIVIQLWRSFPGFRGNSKIGTWMYRVALNTAITGLRNKKDFIQSTDPGELPPVIDDANEYAGKEERMRELYAAIGLLSEIERAIVMLFLEDKKYSEMEEILGINEGALRVRMNRIKEKLRSLTNN